MVELVGAYAADFARHLLSQPGSELLSEELRLAHPERVAEAVLQRLAAQGSKMGAAAGDPAVDDRRSE